jgi:hypothetical protein
MNLAFCDGGLSNRLNVLIFAMILKRKFGHSWAIAWPQNSWCGAAFGRLFSISSEIETQPITYYKAHESDYMFLVHENQGNFDPGRVVFNGSFSTYQDFQRFLDSYPKIFYYNSLIPPFVGIEDIASSLAEVRINDDVRSIATAFCNAMKVDSSVFGLHIRKTDFGDKVDDAELFRLVSASPQRFFVCSDDEEVNYRFSGLPNCSVFKKSYFPQKRIKDAEWLSWNTDQEGRQFPFNIERSEEATVEGLIDLLILSRTTPVRASHSTFFNMALLFKNSGFF